MFTDEGLLDKADGRRLIKVDGRLSPEFTERLPPIVGVLSFIDPDKDWLSLT